MVCFQFSTDFAAFRRTAYWLELKMQVKPMTLGLRCVCIVCSVWQWGFVSHIVIVMFALFGYFVFAHGGYSSFDWYLYFLTKNFVSAVGRMV